MARSAVGWSEIVHAIASEPDELAPRLVAADWLSERGDARGEHVALACELARRGGDAPALAARLAAIDPTPWLAPLEALGARPQSRAHATLELERGFVDRVALAGRDVANTGPLLRREPITRLEIVSGGDGPSALAAGEPELARLRSLALRGRYAAGHGALLRSPHLGALDELAVTELLEAQLAGLADTVVRPRVLRMSPRPAAARLLASSRLFDRVEELYCSSLDDAPLVEIARAPLAALRVLDAGGGWDLGPRGLAALGERLGRLEVLRHQGRLLDRDTLALVARHAGRLRELWLPYLGAELEVALDAVLDSGAFDRLAKLDFTGAHVGAAALARFRARTACDVRV